ncbi:ATP-binding protein [Enterocloster aldenensis]|uniref:ATP-binding protein n=1 Tax=Enterocloster aldenensis TaxID=358742 RepID=UPI004028FA48
MLVTVGIMYFFINIRCKKTPVVSGYYCARAFLLAEFAASLEWQLHCYYFFQSGSNHSMVAAFLFLVVYGSVFTLAWHIEKRLLPSGYSFEISGRELWSAVIIVFSAFSFSNLSFIYQNSPFSGRLVSDIFNIRTLVDLGGIAVIYAFQSRIYELNMEKELSAINATLKSQYEQYRYFQESMEMVHIKYHDLQHQIAGLRAVTDAGERKEWLDTMEKDLKTYESLNKTGNQVLDTLLASKIHNCMKNDVRITCVADGKLLNFMHVTDICTIFGNALDNAIESVVMLPDPAQRLIHISVSGKKGFLFIKIENYCNEKVEIKDKLPVTTKPDKRNHGFGLKSIRYSAEKYGGTISVSMEKNWFELNVLIPLPVV